MLETGREHSEHAYRELETHKVSKEELKNQSDERLRQAKEARDEIEAY